MPRVVPLEHASPDVAAAIHAVMVAAYRVEGDILGVADFKPLRRTVAEVKEARGCFVGIWLDDGLAAMAEIEEIRPGLCQIDSLAVSPAHAREGLGSALLRGAIEAHPGDDLTVSTGARNTPALALYAANGFCEESRWTTADGVSMVTLVRRAG